MVDLPQPDGPTSATKSPLLDAQVGQAERVDLLVASPVGQRDVFKLDEIVRMHRARGLRFVGVIAVAPCRGCGIVQRSPAWSDRCYAVGAGMCWMACTERPQPRTPSISLRSFMTKRPRTKVCSGRPLTRRPFHGEIFERDCSAASSRSLRRGSDRRGRYRHPRPAGSRPCADRAPRSSPD